MLGFNSFLDAGSGHDIEVSFVSSERRRVDLLETKNVMKLSRPVSMRYPLEQVKVVYPSRERQVSDCRAALVA